MEFPFSRGVSFYEVNDQVRCGGVRRRLLLLGLLLGRLLRCRCLRLVQELLLSEARGGRAWDASGCQIQVLPLGQEILRKLDARCVT